MLVTQSCLTVCDPMDYSLTRLLCPWNSAGKNSGVGCCFFLQGNTYTCVCIYMCVCVCVCIYVYVVYTFLQFTICVCALAIDYGSAFLIVMASYSIDTI